MTLEELKAAMDAALVASQAASTDKALQVAYAQAKKAYDDAKTESEKEGGGDPDPEELDEEKLDAKTKAHIAKIRKEAAGHRVKAKDLASKLTASEEQKKAILKAAGIEVETENPAEQLKVAQSESQQLALRSAILESAVENGIGKDGLDYYEFLISKEMAGLKEGEELSEEQITKVVAKVKTAGGKAANTSVGNGGGDGKGTPNPNANAGAITLDKFVRMSITEKSKLYQDNLDLYTSLVSEAKAKKMLV